MEQVNVYCKNTDSYYEINVGTSVLDLLKQTGYSPKRRVLAAYIDNQLKELDYQIFRAHTVTFLDITYGDGRRTYIRSLSLVLQKAVHDLFPQYSLILDYNLPQGLYGELREKESGYIAGKSEVIKAIAATSAMVAELKQRMKEIVAADLRIVKSKVTNGDAIKIFEEHCQFEKAILFKSLGFFFVSIYTLDGYSDTFYGPMLYSTGYIEQFNLVHFKEGFCLQFPGEQPPYTLPDEVFSANVQGVELPPCFSGISEEEREHIEKYARENVKLHDVFKENSHWCQIMGVRDIGTVNAAIQKGYGKDIIQVSEALHERKYAHIADTIYRKRENVKLVLIAGPSSSGKTTTSMRVALQLKVVGLNPVVLGMDDYFVDREHTPKDENGNYDFESVYALDIPFLNKQLKQLFNGEEIELPKFNFETGRREFHGKKIKMGSSDILVMEGIHGLNPLLTADIPNENKFKIYASALTSLSIDENNSISTTDNRLLRRMVRDNNFRGIKAEETLSRWQSVRNGEYKNIFPFQENADIMFNSTLIYELPMLKYYAEPLLRRICPLSPNYATALRLLKFLSYIIELNPQEIATIPPTSVMREFVGGSSFTY